MTTVAESLAAPKLKPNALAMAAVAILHALPSGSGVCPIGTFKAYPARPNVQVKTADGGYADYYNVFPIPDPSGLMDWSGTDSIYSTGPRQTDAQILARQVLVDNTALIESGAPIEQWVVTPYLDFNPPDEATSNRPYDESADPGLDTVVLRPQPEPGTSYAIDDPRASAPAATPPVAGTAAPTVPTSSTADPQPTTSSALPGTTAAATPPGIAMTEASTPASIPEKTEEPAPHAEHFAWLREHAALYGRRIEADLLSLLHKAEQAFEAARSTL